MWCDGEYTVLNSSICLSRTASVEKRICHAKAQVNISATSLQLQSMNQPLPSVIMKCRYYKTFEAQQGNMKNWFELVVWNSACVTLVFSFVMDSDTMMLDYEASTTTRSIPSNWMMELPLITTWPRYWPFSLSTSSKTTFRKASYPRNVPIIWRFPFKDSLSRLSWQDTSK